MKQVPAAVAVLVIIFMVVGAGKGRSPQADRATTSPPDPTVVTRGIDDASAAPAIKGLPPESPEETAATQQAAGFKLRRVSVNSGGTIGGVSGSLRAGASAGQSVAGRGTSAGLSLRAGFWHSKASGCPVTLTGDANGNSIINATDAIYVVNYVFRAGPEPLPCAATADVNCSGIVNATDIIFLVNYVFRAGEAPCDACTMIPDVYSCP